MRTDRERLLDIATCCSTILDYVARYHSEEEDVFRDAILHQLTIIGEAVVHLDSDLRLKYSEIPWDTIKAFRNVLVHEYFSIRWDRVWSAIDRIPQLSETVNAILKTEFE
jgi:uncharacterized protein with HEPN domain